MCIHEMQEYKPNPGMVDLSYPEDPQVMAKKGSLFVVRMVWHQLSGRVNQKVEP